jgi:mannonate dehydratase
MTRRKWLMLAGAGLLGLAGLRFGVPRLMRSRAPREASRAAAAFVERCYAGLDRKRVWDTHVHLIGLGTGGSGCRVDPEMLSPLHPVKRFQFDVYKSGAGIDDPATADEDYLARLLTLQRQANPRGKLLLFAFDFFVDEAGIERPERSPLYTPNDYLLRVTEAHEAFVPCASIHPYRRDCVERLDAARERGALAVKWLPNAMGIDPASPRCDAFYRRMAELRLPLISHAGKEYAMDAGAHQEYGNVLRLRRALDAGVRVVVAHCASMGSYQDLDAPDRAQTASFDLFMRLLRNPAHRDNLYGDISTLAHVHHGVEPLRALLRAPELHPRLVYGSDYPLPALRFFVMPGKLALAGLMDAADRKLSDELFDVNPLLFDFAVNRSVRVVEDGRAFRFTPQVFETARLFDGL